MRKAEKRCRDNGNGKAIVGSGPAAHEDAEAAKLPSTIDPDALNGAMQAIGGSRSDLWNSQLIEQTVQTLPIGTYDPAIAEKQYSATIAAMAGMAPKDELEGMMFAQLIAAHNAAMECHRRAMTPTQTFEARRENLTQANKLSRTYATLLEALNRYRGKGQQIVKVEHVHVHSGAQAVVGVVGPEGGDRAKLEDQPHAKQITYAPQPEMRCADEERDLVQVPRDAEPALPNARRHLNGRT
jgi:hypothetical protein